MAEWNGDTLSNINSSRTQVPASVVGRIKIGSYRPTGTD